MQVYCFSPILYSVIYNIYIYIYMYYIWCLFRILRKVVDRIKQMLRRRSSAEVDPVASASANCGVLVSGSSVAGVLISLSKYHIA